jgi:hypothetical protein
VHLLLKLSR